MTKQDQQGVLTTKGEFQKPDKSGQNPTILHIRQVSRRGFVIPGNQEMKTCLKLKPNHTKSIYIMALRFGNRAENTPKRGKYS